MKQHQAESGKIRVRYLEFELDGNNTTLQESIKKITEAIGGRPAIPAKVFGPKAPTTTAQSDGPTDAVAAIEANEPSNDEEVPAINRPPRTRSAATQRAPKILNELRPAENLSFEDYCADKAVSSDVDKALVVAAWCKDHRNVAEVGMDHIYTLFKVMKWPVPPDTSSPLRNLKKAGDIDKGARGLYSINVAGENRLAKLPRK